jgi:WD40 repeat protein
MRTPKLVSVAVISALWMTLLPQTLTRTTLAQQSGLKATMYCIGFGVSDRLYRVDNYATSPTAFDMGTTGVRLTDLAITPSGSAFAITTTGLFNVNLENGKVSLIKELFAHSQNSLEAASDNKLFVWGLGDGVIRTIDLPGLTVKPLVDTKKFGADLALAPGGIDLYGATLDGMLIKVNLTTLAVTVIGSFGIATNAITGLGFASDGQLYGTRGSNTSGLAQVYKINTCTGAATLVGDIAGAGRFGNGGLAMKR